MKKWWFAGLSLIIIVYMCFAVANVTQVPGATQIILYLRNYLYADAVSGQPSGTMGIFTSINKFGFKDFSGTLHKTLDDASGANLTPENRVFFSNASGAAHSDTGFFYDSTTNDLKIDSSVVHHYGKSSCYVTSGAYNGEVYVNGSGVVYVIGSGDTLFTFTDEPL